MLLCCCTEYVIGESDGLGESGGGEGRRFGHVRVMESGGQTDPCRLHLLAGQLQYLLSWVGGGGRE